MQRTSEDVFNGMDSPTKVHDYCPHTGRLTRFTLSVSITNSHRRHITYARFRLVKTACGPLHDSSPNNSTNSNLRLYLQRDSHTRLLLEKPQVLRNEIFRRDGQLGCY